MHSWTLLHRPGISAWLRSPYACFRIARQWPNASLMCHLMDARSGWFIGSSSHFRTSVYSHHCGARTWKMKGLDEPNGPVEARAAHTCASTQARTWCWSTSGQPGLQEWSPRRVSFATCPEANSRAVDWQPPFARARPLCHLHLELGRCACAALG